MPGFFGSLVERRDLTERDWMRGTLLLPETSSGRWVGNENQALAYSGFYRAVRVLSDSVGPMPLEIYENLPAGGRRRATDHPLYRLLHLRPNRWMTKVTLMSTVMGHLACRGNAFLHVVRTGRGVQELFPLRPDRMRIASSLDQQGIYGGPLEMGDTGAELQYFYRLPDGTETFIPTSDLVHLRGLGFDGIRGYSLLQFARESMGLGLATEEFGARFFGNGSRPSGFLKSDKKLDPEVAARLKANFEQWHRGLTQAHRIAVLEEGLSWEAVSIAPDDAQFLQTRKYQVQEMSRWTGVPPHLLFEMDRATFNNIEQQGMEFVNFTLLCWLVLIQEQLTVDLLDDSGRFAIEFEAAGLLRADIRTRASVYGTLIQWGVMNPDEARAKEGMNPRDDGLGGEYLRPVNMASPSDPMAMVDGDDNAGLTPTQQQEVQQLLADASVGAAA